jgi:hypothetical protein
MKVSKSFRSRMYAIMGDDQEIAEVIDWCQETFGQSGSSWRMSQISHGALLIFEDDGLNSLFKLRWWDAREND